MKLMQYWDIFKEHGFDNMDWICCINQHHLNEMGIYKQAHINSFLKFRQSQDRGDKDR